MGFLGGDNDDENNRGTSLMEETLRLNQAELEAKRQNLFQTRLDIIKGQGAENWTPDYNKRAQGHSGQRGGHLKFGGLDIDLNNVQ